ncbi:SemiSWEET transporter [Jeotgalicoccus huakuii]|uniref:SemiSWEET family sugar transporter n=1 Tax=Jeotgalicoccus TaxID=227979 RepID=UPI0003FDCFEE|nr:MULTISPECIES: SemiSWEET transporter [Jeotgalicoccus]MCK1976811.1 SemiSWEET transporter [Jeotgalicoccus huakuii]QQD84467.1 SemiSWEET transporter [Jeotgalicoccus sp. ATCC 8456]
MSITLLGILAGVLTSSAFIPQAFKVIKTQRTQDISIPMYSLSTTGVLVWVIYGILIGDLAIFLTNVVTFIPAVIILIVSIRNYRVEKSEKKIVVENL